MPIILSVSISMHTQIIDHSFCIDAVRAPTTKNIVIIGDSFIALELCGWLTTGLEERKSVSVVMRSDIPMRRKWRAVL